MLAPAGTLALWEHWAPTACPMREAGSEGRAETERPELAHPEEFGPFTLFRRRVGGRTAVAHGGRGSRRTAASRLGRVRWVR